VNSGLYYQVKDAPTISSPKKATVLTLGAVTSPSPYDHVATFTATVKERNTGNPAVGQVEFSVGSQRQTVTLVNGTATTNNMVIQALPGTAGGDSRHYPLTATFIETQSLLPSSASADFVVSKKATNVAFGATPFLVTLTDADANRLRDEAIFFDINGNGVSLTFTSQTGVDGVAQLRIPTGAVPAGTYTLTAYFLGKVPHDTGAFGMVTDDRYSASSATTTITFDPSPPACDLTNAGIDGQGQAFIEVSVGDGNSGLVSVNTTELVNATVSIPSFANGVLSPPNAPLVVRATKVDQTQGAQLGLEVVNAAGSITDCDPVAVAVGGRGEPRTVTVKSVKPKEHFLVIYNGSPGIRNLQVKVNRFTWEVRELKPGEVRTLDIARALNARGTNTVKLTAQGSPNGHAMVLLSDITPRSATARHAQPERSQPNETPEP
jgi:hypothetical protein